MGDRIDESVEFPLPDIDDRVRLLHLYFAKYLGHTVMLPESKENQKKNGDNAAGQPLQEDSAKSISTQLAGFSGREISKLCMALQTHVYSNSKGGHLELSNKLLRDVVTMKVKEHTR